MASAAPKRSSKLRNTSLEATSRRDALYASNRRSLRHGRSSVESLQRKRMRHSQSQTQTQTQTSEPVQMRSGQQFRVGNVTSNGRLQLRPVAGDAQPFSSPPTSPVPDGATSRTPEPFFPDNWRDSNLSGSVVSYNSQAPAGTTAVTEGAGPEYASTTQPDQSRARSHSFSTADGHVSVDPREGNPNASGIKIVVDKPVSKRPVSTVDQSMHLLSVSIPHYRLGTPQFSGKGSAVLHSSINTGSSLSTGFRSSTISARDIDRMFPQPPRSARRSRSNSRTFPQPVDSSLPHQLAARASQVDPFRTRDSQQLPEPTALIELESQPSTRHRRSLIRLSRLSGQIVAATPSGLIAQITSPNLLDYELLSDFFLTFRSYLTVHDLNDYLLARLQWAISRSDDFGRIVRVRTFVALRHWILNYFVDDFVSDHELRVEFCNRVNQLCADLRSRSNGGGGDLNILGELKRCWRRTCAQYWEIPEHKNVSATDNILPGRPLGYMSASIHLDSPKSPLASMLQPSGRDTISTRSPDLSNVQRDSVQAQFSQSRPFRSSNIILDEGKVYPQHRNSDQSVHITSCSIPIRISPISRPRSQSQTRRNPQAATSNLPSSITPPAPSSNALLYHSRTTSFSDALRDANRTATSDDKETTHGSNSMISTPLGAGSLIRGYVVRPVQPYVESVVADTAAEEKIIGNPKPASPNDSVFTEDKNSEPSPGVRRFLGSVRRALSAKQATSQNRPADRQKLVTRRSPPGSQVPLSRSSSRATYGTPKRQVVNGRITPRIDMLALVVLERYQAASDEGSVETSTAPPAGTQTINSSDRASNQKRPVLSIPSQRPDPRVQSNVTMGSRSIVIVDDTGDRPAMPQRPLTEISRYGKNISMRESEYSAKNDNRQTIPIGVDTRPATARFNQEPAYLDDKTPTDSPNSEQATPTAPTEQNDEITAQPTDGSFFNDAELESEQMSDVMPSATKSVDEANPSSIPGAQAMPESSNARDDPNRDQQPQLRRRPGGDLRAVDHVHSLEENQIRQSLHSSVSDAAQGPSGEPQDTNAPQPVSVIVTDSSQTVLRPSFEKAVAKLAQLPDDSSDDGGIESTLRKLEGTGRRVDHKTVRAVIDEQDESNIPSRPGEPSVSAITSAGQRPKQPSRQGSISESEVSDSSIPLLERGVSQRVPKSKKKQSSLGWLAVSLPQEQSNQSSSKAAGRTDNQVLGAAKSSADELVGQSRYRNNPPKSSSTHKSFLLDDNQSLNENAPSTLTGGQREGLVEKEYPESFYFDDEASINQDPDLLPHPLRHPETPPKPKDWPLSAQQEFRPMEPSLQGYISQKDRDAFSAKTASTKPGPPLTGTTAAAPPSPLARPRANDGSHLPFILGFDSNLLAQQFTLVEKDALSEVDWRQLIDLRWNAHAKISSTWYDCLKRSTEAAATATDGQLSGGVDMCITRFNMVVKWAASEIVLCQDVTERVACIVKYIHIARQVRRLRNWATMFQITMALVSADISRLKTTWQQVPEKEREYLKTLENLISPTRNFHNLREEIDMAVAGMPAPGTDGGCVPFIGIYTHDLIYNSQKPAFAEPARELDSDEPLINFEKHRTAATIVKHLLRLVDASSKYPFQPVPDVLSRCLWMATLEDEEISARSKKLEP